MCFVYSFGQGFSFLNVFSDSRNLPPLISQKDLVLCCVIPLNLSSCSFPFHVVVLMWLWLLYFHFVRVWINFFYMECNRSEV